MTGILNAASQDHFTDDKGQVWTFFQDSEQASIYYVVQAPGIRIQNGVPVFHLTEYTDKSGAVVSASCKISTSLSPPPLTVQIGIGKLLNAKGISSPNYQAMPYVDIGTGPERNWAFLNYANSNGSVSQSFSATPSLSGAQTANFFLPNLNPTEVQFFKDYFGGDPDAGTVTISYRLTVMAHLDGIAATVKFDSTKAYDYQRTFKWVS